jgi:hypothetical protein
MNSPENPIYILLINNEEQKLVWHELELKLELGAYASELELELRAYIDIHYTIKSL